MNMTDSQLADAILEQIKLSPNEHLYGIVDSAKDMDLAFEAKCLYGREIVSLFQGDMAAAATTVAPYVVPIDPAGGYLQNWARRWGKNAGILLTTSAQADILHAHLRGIFIAKNEQGQEYFFRFYDPRVLRGFLPTCQPEELREFFGPIVRFVADDEPSDYYVGYSCSNGILIQDSVRKELPATG